MPKIVNHEAQRDLFAAAAMRRVAGEGFEGLTMRGVATEAGLSYGSLFHYFKSKDELLSYAVQHSMTSQTQRLDEVAESFSGLAALERLLYDDAVIDDTSREAWLVWMAFLYKASHDKAFAAMYEELIDGWLGRISHALEQALATGEISSDLNVEEEALGIWAYSAGIGQVALMHADLLTPKRQQEMISAYLNRLRN